MLKTLKYIFVLLIIASANAVTSEDSKVPLAYHIFTSQAYDSYLDQLHVFVAKKTTKHPELLSLPNRMTSTLFQLKGLELIRWIKMGKSLQDTDEKRQFHKEMIVKLRNVIELKEQNLHSDDLTLSISAFIDDLCVWMYTKPEFLNFMQNFMEQNLTFNLSANPESAPWTDQLQHLYDTINNDLRFNGTIKSSDKFHNPHPEGDIPSHLFSIFDGDHEIAFIRTHSTIYESLGTNGQMQVEAIPEFTNYLSALSKQNKLHLYVNYMARQGNDKFRTPIIEGLENDPRFGSTIAVISLARNSDFYDQKNGFSQLNNAEMFKAAFMEELFLDTSIGNYYWSNKIDLPSWQEKVVSILEEVHSQYFVNSPVMSVDERKQFIDLAYVKITEHLIALFQPDAVNLSCAITIDRGPTAFTLLYLDLLLQQNKTIDEDTLKTIATLVYGPGVLVRNRSIDPIHNQHFINAAKRLITFVPAEL